MDEIKFPHTFIQTKGKAQIDLASTLPKVRTQADLTLIELTKGFDVGRIYVVAGRAV